MKSGESKEMAQNELFDKDTYLEATPELKVIEDKDDISNYSFDNTRNCVFVGDTFKVLPKLESESIDMVFVDPPYFLQLPKKELKRWKVKTIVEGVNDKWVVFVI